MFGSILHPGGAGQANQPTFRRQATSPFADSNRFSFTRFHAIQSAVKSAPDHDLGIINVPVSFFTFEISFYNSFELHLVFSVVKVRKYILLI